MPYLTQRERHVVDNSGVAINAGELNYRLTTICLAGGGALSDRLFDACLKFLGDEYRYANLNDVIGALECARMEMIRRRGTSIWRCLEALKLAKQLFYAEVVAPYEDAKIAVNGDVYP